MADVPEPPQIEYPTLYTFRSIGRHDAGFRARVHAAVQSVVGTVAEDAVAERPSKKNGWVAIHVTCLLTSEAQRVAVYLKLKEDPSCVLTL